MKVQFTILLAAILSLAIPIQLKSQEPLRHHIIIAVDKAGCDWIKQDLVSQHVKKLILDSPFTNSAGRKHLFEPGDYISIVGFRINQSQTDMDVFAMPLHKDNKNISWNPLSLSNLDSLFSFNWNSIVSQSFNPGDSGYSLVSVAKAYALRAVPSIENRIVGRTFLIMITDHRYNGNDFYDEIFNFNTMQREHRVANPLNADKIFEKSYDVEHHYYIRYISHSEIRKKQFLEFYEYVPLQQNFSMQTAVSYPTHLRAVKKRDGSFEVKVPLEWLNNSNYYFNRLEAFANTTESIIYDSPQDAKIVTSLPDTLSITLPDNKTKHIQLRGWLILNDGFYNGTLLSANLESPLELGRDGLNILIPIEYESDATIYGSTTAAQIGWELLPFIDDQHEAAHIWEFFILPIMILALLALIGYRLAKPEYYNPTADEFTIGKDE